MFYLRGENKAVENMKRTNAIFLVSCICLYAPSVWGQAVEPTDSLVHELQEVIVAAKQPATTLVGTTLVTSIPGSNLADIGNALDVLAQLPMLKVDEELRRILSSNLKRVELLMAPGAAYESTTGAVLRITTKRSFIQGLSLTDQFQLTRRRKWSLTNLLGLSYRVGDWELFLDGSLTRSNSLTKGTTTNTLVYDGQETVVGSWQNNIYPTTAGSIKVGFNYAKGSRSLGAYYRYNPERGDFSNDGAEWLDDNAPLLRRIDRRIRAHSHLVSLYYENTLADNCLLHCSLRKSTIWAGKLYLQFPLGKGNLTVGTQDSYTHTSLDYRMLNEQVSQYIPSSQTDARQTSAALFASWARMFGKLSLSIGARYEYVDYDFKVNGKRDDEVSRRDHLFTPDISLTYSFNDKAQISLNYKMATVKPSYSQLTSSLSYTGLHEIEGGNPALRDEKMHDVQLFGMWNGFMLQADFTRSLDAYAFVKQLYPADNLQLLMRPVNIDVSALDLYLVWSKPVRRWTPNVTLGMYRQWLMLDDASYEKSIFSYYFDNTFSFLRGWMVTANFHGQTQGDIRTNRFGATRFAMDASVGKTFLHKSLTVKLTATDIFNTVNNDWTMNTYGVFVDKRQRSDNRGISLSVIYHFQPRKREYKGSSAAEEELRRL